MPDDCLAQMTYGDPMGADGAGYGAWLRLTRRAAGLRQEDLAEMAGMHVTTVIRQERGQIPEPDTLMRMASALRADIREPLAIIYRLEDPAGDDQIPPELTRLVALYSRLAPADQARMLASLDLVSDWADQVISRQSAGRSVA
jgi:transcriptional regulator with XRE-family HTH domain